MTRSRLILDPSGSSSSEVGRWLAALEDCRRRTLDVLKEAPEGHPDAATPSGPNTVGTLLYHIAAIEADWLFTEVLEGTRPWPEHLFPFDVRDESGLLTAVDGIPLQAHLERLAAVRAVVADSLGPMDEEEFHRIRSLPDYDVTPDWVLHHLLQHEAEHRAQIAALIGASPG
jgi:uncharacterized damage-inducible protein DinB